MNTGIVPGEQAEAVPDLPAPAAAARCANCGTSAPGEFCARCGQETLAPPALTEFFKGSLAHFLSLESRAWQTLSRLVFAPGLLTVEYLAGRRARYVRPLRLYLWMSVFAIAAIESMGVNLGLRYPGGEGIYLLELEPKPADQRTGIDRLQPMPFVLEHFNTPAIERFKALPAQDQLRLVQEKRHGNMKYFMLFLVPVFALTVQLAYLDSRRHYGEHLVFCLHAQTFLLLALLAETVLPDPLAWLTSAWVIAYFYIALKRAYGRSWTGTALRGTFILLSLVTIFLVFGAALVFVLLQTG